MNTLGRSGVIAFLFVTLSACGGSSTGGGSGGGGGALGGSGGGGASGGTGGDDIPPVRLPEAAQIRVPHPSAQAHVLIGMPGIKREDPDYYPLLIGNYVLGGGGFVSRLVKEVREKRGFAYSAYSYFSPQQEAGPFRIGLQTKGSQVQEALDVVDRTLRDFIEQGPTEEELAAARDYTINGFGLRLDSNRKVLGYVSMIGFYRLPLDWLDQYPRQVAELSVAQVRDAFRRRVLPQHLVSVVVGGDGDTAHAAAPPAAMQ